MFGFFDDPFDDFFYYPRQLIIRRPNYVDEYYNQVQRRLNQVLRDEFGLPPNPTRADIQRRAAELQRHMDEAAHGGKKEEDSDEKEEKKPKRQLPYYFYQSSSYSNGNDFVEEHREKKTDKDGKVHTITRRRLGDRWYESESITDENGKESTKETWHNVPEDKIESFKEEWCKKHGQKYEALPHDNDQKAVTHDEKKPEDQK